MILCFFLGGAAIRNEGKNLWKLSLDISQIFPEQPVATVLHHCQPQDGWAVSAFPHPGSSFRAGKELKKGPGFAFPGRRLLLGVILRCPVAANVLAANGGEASKFTSAAECNSTEHLLMNESAAHQLSESGPADEKFNVLLAGTLVLHYSPEPRELY